MDAQLTRYILEKMWGYKGRIVVERDGMTPIFLEHITPYNDTFFHIQDDIDNSTVSIWRMAEWKASQQRHIKFKAASEERMQKLTAKKELIDAVAPLIAEQMSMPSDQARKFAEQIVETQNKTLIKMLGLEEQFNKML